MHRITANHVTFVPITRRFTMRLRCVIRQLQTSVSTRQYIRIIASNISGGDG
jgi:hypothetical protein